MKYPKEFKPPEELFSGEIGKSLIENMEMKIQMRIEKRIEERIGMLAGSIVGRLVERLVEERTAKRSRMERIKRGISRQFAACWPRPPRKK